MAASASGPPTGGREIRARPGATGARRIPGLVLFLCGALIPAFAACSGGTPPIRDAEGNRVPGSVATLEPVEIGGMEQWVLIRGRDASNPVLLWLHGGPGAAEMPVVPHYVRGLEDHFVTVHWDQRGAGKSNPDDFEAGTMTFERFVADGRAMTEHLQERFDREKIYLLGHSWGSHLGLVLAHRDPENYWAYVGVSQHVDADRSHRIAHDWLEERIRDAGDEGDLQALRELGPPPYRDHETFVEFVGLVDAYGGDFDVGMLELVRVGLTSPHYTLGDLLSWFRGANRGSGPMWDDRDYQYFDAFQEVPRLEVPAYFFNGARDYNTPLAVTRAYVDALEAPEGKELVVFENSAHTPFLAEPERFERALVRVKRGTWRQAGSASSP